MNSNRKAVKAFAAVAAAGTVIAGAGMTADAAPLAGITSVTTEKPAANKAASSTTLSGVSLKLTSILTDAQNTDATVSENETDTVAAPQEAQPQEQKQVNPYANIGIAKVSGSYLNVRNAADPNGEVVGYLYDGSACTVDPNQSVQGWYYISSGDVAGFVSSDFVVVGDAAACEAAQTTTGTIAASGLKLRQAPAADATVLTQLYEGQQATVVDKAHEAEGWIGINADVNGQTVSGYVSAQYIQTTSSYSYGETVAAVQARQEAERAAAEAAAEAQRQAAAAEAARQQAAARRTASRSTAAQSSGSSASASYGTAGTGSKTGASVAATAQKYLGNPYVYGGTSLTHGTDCSGFVMSVYAQYGVSLPHSSSADRSVGRAVSTSQMAPGDIVCYSGHVGIYVGGGKIISAANPRAGIKYDPVNYKPVVAVRRIF